MTGTSFNVFIKKNTLYKEILCRCILDKTRGYKMKTYK